MMRLSSPSCAANAAPSADTPSCHPTHRASAAANRPLIGPPRGAQGRRRRRHWTRLVPSFRTNWTRLVPSSGREAARTWRQPSPQSEMTTESKMVWSLVLNMACSIFCAAAMPAAFTTPWPSGPVVASMPCEACPISTGGMDETRPLCTGGRGGDRGVVLRVGELRVARGHRVVLAEVLDLQPPAASS